MTDQEQQPGPDQDGLIWMLSREAAKIYDKDARTIRKWRDAGKIEGRKINGMWYMGVPREDLIERGHDPDKMDREFGEKLNDFPQGTVVLRDHGPGPGPVDFGPMAELVADLTKQVIEAQSAAAMYQERAAQLEARLNSTTLALESGKVEASEEQQRLEEEKQAAIKAAEADRQAAITAAREEAARERDEQWRSKSWWQRLRGE